MSASPAIRPHAALDALASGSPLAALRAQAELLRAPRPSIDVDALGSLVDSGDRLARALSIRPLARNGAAELDGALLDLAASPDPLLAEQAVWALADRPATPGGTDVLLGAIAAGGHGATLAQLAFERWAASDPTLPAAIPTAVRRESEAGARVRLVETAALADHAVITLFLARLIRSADEDDAVRAAAARAFAARPAPALLDDIWRAGSDAGPELRFACARALLAMHTPRARRAAAALARAVQDSNEPFDHLLQAVVRGRAAGPFAGRGGIRIAQIFMQGRLDGALSSAGAGDGGGISTLLVQLGRALGSQPEVAGVATIARALAEPATDWGHTALSEAVGPGASIERVPFGPAGDLPAAAMWEHRLELERGLETAISELGGVDIAHIRFADAAAFAAARVCRRLGIPVAFTAAPDPHAVIQAAERRGDLTRESFPDAELSEHYLFRAQLVADLLGQAEAVVVLPRPRARAALSSLIGASFTELEPDRVHTIPEGISLLEIDGAAAELARAGRDRALPRVANVLLDRIAALPRQRHGLPLLVSVGRLHRVKGLSLLLEAWAGADDLQRSFNLVLVGGGLEQPTPEEATVLRQFEAVCATHPRAREGFVLLGQRPNREVALLLRTARVGIGSLVAPDGVYACTSQKEEFGVALLEAMATGLSVVAPDAGGPATYVEEGLTGALADTSSVEEVRAALRLAAAARADESRARRTSDVVRSGYTIEAMAATLAGVYTSVVREPVRVAA